MTDCIDLVRVFHRPSQAPCRRPQACQRHLNAALAPTSGPGRAAKPAVWAGAKRTKGVHAAVGGVPWLGESKRAAL